MIFPLIGIIIGVILVLYRKEFAKKLTDSQNKMWGFKFGGAERNITSFISALTGIFLLIFNITALIQHF